MHFFYDTFFPGLFFRPEITPSYLRHASVSTPSQLPLNSLSTPSTLRPIIVPPVPGDSVAQVRRYMPVDISSRMCKFLSVLYCGTDL